jgi:hypothetical protein
VPSRGVPWKVEAWVEHPVLTVAVRVWTAFGSMHQRHDVELTPTSNHPELCSKPNDPATWQQTSQRLCNPGIGTSSHGFPPLDVDIHRGSEAVALFLFSAQALSNRSKSFASWPEDPFLSEHE